MTTLTFATRPSKLARWQTNYICRQLQLAWDDLVCEQSVITTKGDRILNKPIPEIGGKGLFTHELERALREGHVDAAVHSLKDLPTEDAPGLTVGVVPERVDPGETLICPAGHTLEDLPSGARVGTSSVRRRAQLLAVRPDLQVLPLRGNVDTRLRKVIEGRYDAIVLAAAGVTRLELQKYITQYLPYDFMLPAPGQGALAVQCRENDVHTLSLLRALDHPPTRLAVAAERAFLSALGGGCSLPVGALATVSGAEIELQGVIVSPDGTDVLRLQGAHTDPHKLGVELAQRAFAKGAAEVMS
jgi:hydroxymethylbilane synthase